MLKKQRIIHLALLGGIFFYSLIVLAKPVVAGTGYCRSCDGKLRIAYRIKVNTKKNYGANNIKFIVIVFGKTHELADIQSSKYASGYREFSGEVHDCRTFADFGFNVNGKHIFPSQLKNTVQYQTSDPDRHASCNGAKLIQVITEELAGYRLCTINAGRYGCITLKN